MGKLAKNWAIIFDNFQSFSELSGTVSRSLLEASRNHSALVNAFSFSFVQVFLIPLKYFRYFRWFNTHLPLVFYSPLANIANQIHCTPTNNMKNVNFSSSPYSFSYLPRVISSCKMPKMKYETNMPIVAMAHFSRRFNLKLNIFRYFFALFTAKLIVVMVQR